MALVVITVSATYDDGVNPDFTDRFTDAQGYQVNIPDGLGGFIPNPVTRAAYLQTVAENFFRGWLENTYKQEKDRQSIIADAPTNTIDFS